MVPCHRRKRALIARVLPLVAPLHEPFASWLLALLAAPFVGSFLGVLITRLPEGEPILLSRSHCTYCNHKLGVRDLIPLVSWFALHRRCRHCGSPLSWFYPNIEIAAAFVTVWAAAVVSGGLLWMTCLLGWGLLTLALIDARHFILPDVLTLPLLAVGLGVAAVLDSTHAAEHALAAALGFCGFWLVGWIYKTLRGREGLGLGDAKLLAAAGAWVSWQGLPGVIFFASASALLIVLIGAAVGGETSLKRRMPFGPYLCLGTWLVWLYGPLLLG
jgi:leader peptidase (prepilin peptidase) / N-methyltransferase